MKIGLGTVQFGCNYGISNKSGQVNFKEIERILKYAEDVGIDTLDTAQKYGSSEELLGKFDLSSFKVITKLIGGFGLEDSLNRLNLSNIYGVMFHDIIEINDKSWKKFESYKEQGLAQKIGVSVYKPDELLSLIKKYPIDIVQLPLNIVDQRFLKIFPQLKKQNIEIHSRSAFLQGLLLMNENDIDDYFEKIKPVLAQIPENKLENAIGFVNTVDEVDKIIVGTTSLDELKQIVDATNKNIVPKNAERFIITDEDFILPQNWKLKEHWS